MPLEPTDHPEHRSTRTSRRRVLLAAVALVAVSLAGCAEGTRSDAERGKREDQQRESVVKDLQATETFRIVHSPATPTPEPEEE